MKKIILLSIFLILSSNTFAKEITKNITVSVMITYDCSKVNEDEKIKKYCKEKQNPIIKIENNYLIKEY